MKISVIICTYQPSPESYRRVLAGLSRQSLPRDLWELLIVDNDSPQPSRLHEEFAPALAPRCLSAPQPGQAHARRTGLGAAAGGLIVFVDQDNVLAPDYLSRVLQRFEEHPEVGLAGGKSLPEFAGNPPPWTREFWPLLALRDLGDSPRIAHPHRKPDGGLASYPPEAPHGAGMAGRREAFAAWLRDSEARISGRRRASLSSADDNEIVIHAMKAGWAVAYFPDLVLTHLIPPERLSEGYLARINHGIQRSWLQLLLAHGLSPWRPIAPWTLVPRKLRSWLAHRAWRGPAERIRWRGACGHFEGRVHGHRLS